MVGPQVHAPTIVQEFSWLVVFSTPICRVNKCKNRLAANATRSALAGTSA